MISISKPTKEEFAPFYENYINQVNDDVIKFLEKQLLRFNDICENIEESKRSFRYAPEKWSVKELIGHCTDTERIMAYRLLRIARADKTELAGFDENEYVANANFENRTWESLLSEFQALRSSNIILIKSLTNDQIMAMGTANKLPISARALVYIIAGHLEHHLDILIRRYLK